MRKTMLKEVTKTTVTVARIVKGEDGQPVMEQLPTQVLIGNVSLEKAQKEVNKGLTIPVTVFAVEPSTEVYEMAVEDFIKYASLKVEPPVQTEIVTEEAASETAEATV